jgi:hypothetical protein
VAQVDLTEEECVYIWKMLNQVSVQGLESMTIVLGLAEKIARVSTQSHQSLNGVHEPIIPTN